MALNYTVSYTFTPSTTISSSQVNTNFSDNANTWNGIEALTKTFAKLKVDVDPATALEVATKQYVDHYSTWRRPTLGWAGITSIYLEYSLNGTGSSNTLLFPDGTLISQSGGLNASVFTITQNAVLTTAGAQGGLRAGLTEANNTWYAIYGVRSTDSSTLWVLVGDTLLPVPGNFATLNSNFGANRWIYLGMIRNGDNNGSTGDILNFVQAGHITVFKNTLTTAGGLNGTQPSFGLKLATTASASTLTYTYSNGTGTTNIPDNLPIVLYQYQGTGIASNILVRDSTAIRGYYHQAMNSSIWGNGSWHDASSGIQLFPAAGPLAMDIILGGFVDIVLGVGSNPLF